MLFIQAAEDGLTLRDIVADIPHDAGALVVYALMAVFFGFIWYGNKGARKAPSRNGVDRDPAERPVETELPM